MSQSATLSDSDLLRRDRRVISLIGVSHGASHFYQLALPPLFTLINKAEGYSFVELATLTLAFYIASAICQPFSGFLVDRFGARRVLLAGLGTLAAGTTLIGVLPFYPAMFVLSIVAGIGNSVFHPCDYSIMNVFRQCAGTALSGRVFAAPRHDDADPGSLGRQPADG